MPDPLFAPWALILIPLGYLSLWPLVSRLLTHDGRQPDLLECLLLTFAVSPTVLTLALFWIGILPRNWITPFTVLIIVGALWMVGLLVNRGWLRTFNIRDARVRVWEALRRLEVQSLILWMMIGAIWIMLIHALYYPFIGDDTLSRYGLYAKQIYLTHQIGPTITGYPPHISLVWTTIWFAAGHINEHLARVYSVLLAAGMIGATYLVGREVRGHNHGLIAAAILTVTPMFFQNATLDYVDIPTAFPLTLSLFYVLRWWRSGHVREAFGASVLLGVALFTKQAAMTWVASYAVVLVLWVINSRHDNALKHIVWNGAAFLLPALFIGAPWYARNLLLTRLYFPIAGYYHILGEQTGILGIVPPLAWMRDFGYAIMPFYSIGWVMGLGLAVSQGIDGLRGRLSTTPVHLIFGIITVPYWLAWWRTFSFEARFLLLILPVMAVWAAFPLLWTMELLTSRIRVHSTVYRVLAGITLLGLLFVAARERLGALYYGLTHPFMSEADRVRHVHGSLYGIIVYVEDNMNPETDRIMAMDGRLEYYLPDYQIKTAYPLELTDLEGFDYLIHSSSFYGIYDGRLGWDRSEFYLHVWDAELFEPIYESNGVHIMRILRTRLSEAH